MACRSIKKQGVTPIDTWDRYGFLFDSSTLMSLIDRNDVMSRISSIENIGEYEKIILYR